MSKTFIDAAELEGIVAPICAAHGVALVDARLQREPQGLVLRVLIEPPDAERLPPGAGGVTLDDCSRVSRALSAALDDHDDLIESSYQLEVGSPGIERPLVKPGDYERFSGREVRVKTRTPIGQRKNFTAMLMGRRADHIVLQAGHGEELEIPFRNIAKANLVFRF